MFSRMFSVAAWVRDFVEARTHAQRYAVKKSLWVSLTGPQKAQSGPLPPSYALKLTLPGYTYDVSENGLAMILPAVHLGGFYFTDGERRLRVTINTDDTTLQMEVLPVRYEQLEDSGGYLVGAKIVAINEADQPLFEGFLRSLGAPRQRQRQGAVSKSSYTPKMTPKAASFGFINRIL